VDHALGVEVRGDYQSCLDRWCGNTADYDATKMSTNFGPVSRGASGIMNRNKDNPFGDLNIVFIYYCDSNAHGGDGGDIVMTDATDSTKQFRIHSRGHAIVDAFIDMLLTTISSSRLIPRSQRGLLPVGPATPC